MAFGDEFLAVTTGDGCQHDHRNRSIKLDNLWDRILPEQVRQASTYLRSARANGPTPSYRFSTPFWTERVRFVWP